MSMRGRRLRVSPVELPSDELWTLTTHAEPLPDPAKFEPRDGESERAASKRKNQVIQAEYNAMTCVAVYMLLMTFSQKGIDHLREHLDAMQARDPDGEYEIGDGFDEGTPSYAIRLPVRR